MSLPQIDLTLKPVWQECVVKINGQEVPGIQGIHVSREPGAVVVPRVFLEVSGEVVLDTEAVVEAGQRVDFSRAVEKWLGDLDPEKLERAMLDSIGDVGAETTGQACLTILSAWARGDVS